MDKIKRVIEKIREFPIWLYMRYQIKLWELEEMMDELMKEYKMWRK